MSGMLMAQEAAEAEGVYARAVAQRVDWGWARPRAVYTVARGSSDAAALVLAYEVMRRTGLPCTSLPPSVFSLGAGVAMDGALVVVISQSGASDDLVAAARGAAARGARVVAITNAPGSQVEAAAHLTVPIGAGPERAIPATKSVVGAVGAGLALLAALAPDEALRAPLDVGRLADADALAVQLAGAQSLYIVGRDSGFGAAQEVALKLKETCALHAEAYSASEVLHGPLQLATGGLLALVLDTGPDAAQASLATAADRLERAGAGVVRLGSAPGLVPAAEAARHLCRLYPVIRAAALARGLDPDAPAHLSKVTRTT